jgi:pyrroline-5-carboxylate reductase
MQSIAIIGIGNMGSIIYHSLLDVFDIKNLYICDKNKKKLDLISENITLPKANYTLDANEILDKVDIVILAMKPQAFADFCESLKVDLKDKLIISIMAGMSMKVLKKKLKVKKVVRSMPNLCIRVNNGLIGWIATDEVSAKEKAFVKKIFESLGEQIEVDEEAKIDSITALSGTGPAYFFYLCELLEEKAWDLGFDVEDAKKIADTTFVGSALTLNRSNLDAKSWRKAVTSKGGTTQAALEYLEDHKFADVFKKGVEKARKRSKELGK